MRLKWWRYQLWEAVMSMKSFDATEIIRVLAGQLITVAAMADGSCDDDFVLVRLLLTMVSEYDPYLGGASPRAWCLQPWRVGSSFVQ
ncbi:hypothetical protein Tco_1324349, partial [Tanacetum coccineum]